MPRLAAVCLMLLLLRGEAVPDGTPAAPAARTGTTTRPSDETPANNGPDTILLDMLRGQPGEDWFEPVPFNHASHAEMTGDCTVCHHHSPEGEAHPECRSCHEAQLLRENILQPSLKGAYHRQCMGCHREWAHGDHCQACHLPNGPSNPRTPPPSPFGMADEHIIVSQPDVKVYETEVPPGVKSSVVFRHNDHVERYGNACVDCHRSDNCTRCHDVQAPRLEMDPLPVQAIQIEERSCESCTVCHDVNDEARCASCHEQGEPKLGPFNHDETGWPLAAYHEDRGCRDCHQEGPAVALDSKCNSCHAGAAMAAGLQTLPPVEDPHAEWYDYIRREAASELCVECHSDLAPGGEGQMHPTGPMAEAVPAKLIQAGAQVKGDANQLTCLVCHSSATSRFDPIVLPDSGPDGLCLACHPQEAKIFGTVHDINSDSAGRADLARAASPGGTCRTCHPVHTSARTAAPTPGDPSGLCTSCHQPRSWAQAKSATEFSHPDATCTDCHNPHKSQFGRFLAKPADELCTACHAEQARLADGPHDPTRHPEAWPDAAAAARGVCLACHVPHRDQTQGLLRFPGPQADSTHDAACLACHPDAAWDAEGDRAILHPHEITPDQEKIDLTLVRSGESGKRRMGCRTCHEPHGGAAPGYLTRGAPDEHAGLCLQCHTEKKYIAYTGHSNESLTGASFDTGSCRPCHAVHANRDESWGLLLSPRFLLDPAAAPADPVDSGVPCLACHRKEGPAPVPEAASHPPVVNPTTVQPGAPGYLPRFDASGHESPDGQVTCRTCHLSHGRLDLLQLAAENETMSEQQRRAMKLNLREFTEPNLCTQCHGQEGRLRFLFYHHEQRREKLGLTR